MMDPLPTRFFVEISPGTGPLLEREVYFANSVSRLWFVPPQRHVVMAVDCGFFDGSYANPPQATDGVEVRVSEVLADGSLRPVFSRLIDPVSNRADRGLQRLRFDFEMTDGREIVLESLPGPADSKAFDWFYFALVRVR